jgi:hypothetical protein
VKKLLIGGVAAILMMQVPAHAAERGPSAGNIEAAAALVEKLELERVLDSMFSTLKNMFAENAIAAMTRDDSEGKMRDFFNALPGGRDRFAQILGDEFLEALRRQYPEMKMAMAKEYAAAFNRTELEELTGFFSTGVGQKWQAVSPQVEKSMGEWGRKAGMKAGAEAFAAAIKRLENGQADGNGEK